MDLLRSKLEELSLMHLGADSLYGLGANKIQESKLDNIKSIHKIKDENILFIHDSTIFGSAKDGMVFTNKGIYWKERLGPSKNLSFQEIIASTANVNMADTYIYTLSNPKGIKIKEDFYNLIAQIRLEFINSFESYQAYYNEAIMTFENLLLARIKEENFNKVITILNKCQGLFLTTKDITTLIYQIWFKAYLENKDFDMAREKLEIIKSKDPVFYKNAVPNLRNRAKEEEVLGLISMYKFKEARESIGLLSDKNLALSLMGNLEASKSKMYTDIKKAVEEKDYSYFNSLPETLNFKDEHGMSALEYFALEGDVKGILMALGDRDLLLLHYNIYGHNFIDLIGFACDPRLGNKSKDILFILEGIRRKVNHKILDDRINFIKKGKEGWFFSYNISEEGLKALDNDEQERIRQARLFELNDRLLSISYFKYRAYQIENGESATVDKIIKRIFANELEDIEEYPVKEEFESSSSYYKRCLSFKQEYLGRKDFIDEYKRQNPKLLEDISRTLENNKELFKVSLSALRKLNKGEELTKLYSLYFPIKNPSIKIDSYNRDRECFFVIVDGRLKTMDVPIDKAKEILEDLKKGEVISKWDFINDNPSIVHGIKVEENLYIIK